MREWIGKPKEKIFAWCRGRPAADEFKGRSEKYSRSQIAEGLRQVSSWRPASDGWK